MSDLGLLFGATAPPVHRIAEKSPLSSKQKVTAETLAFQRSLIYSNVEGFRNPT